MADDPKTAKSERKPVKTSSLLTNILLALLDTVLTLFLFTMPFSSFGAYWNFILPEFGIGVMYLIVRLILKNVEQTNFTNRCYIVLRIFGVTVALFYIMLFNFGNSFSWFYPIRKTLYIAGNSANTDASYFVFLPDKLPDKTENYYMNFVPPVAAPEAPREIEIRFYTDELGTEELRSTALEKGAELCSGDEWQYGKLIEHCESEGYDIQGAEVYIFEQISQWAVTGYILNEATGFCMIYWLV